jgi:hypothetical protein
MFSRIRLLASPIARSTRKPLQSLCTSAAAMEERYSPQLATVHWLGAAAFATCVATVKSAQWTDGPTSLGTKAETKGKLMMWHKCAGTRSLQARPLRLLAARWDGMCYPLPVSLPPCLCAPFRGCLPECRKDGCFSENVRLQPSSAGR